MSDPVHNRDYSVKRRLPNVVYCDLYQGIYAGIVGLASTRSHLVFIATIQNNLQGFTSCTIFISIIVFGEKESETKSRHKKLVNRTTNLKFIEAEAKFLV